LSRSRSADVKSPSPPEAPQDALAVATEEFLDGPLASASGGPEPRLLSAVRCYRAITLTSDPRQSAHSTHDYVGNAIPIYRQKRHSSCALLSCPVNSFWELFDGSFVLGLVCGKVTAIRSGGLSCSASGVHASRFDGADRVWGAGSPGTRKGGRNRAGTATCSISRWKSAEGMG
jgi:hypothetical protein